MLKEVLRICLQLGTKATTISNLMRGAQTSGVKSLTALYSDCQGFAKWISSTQLNRSMYSFMCTFLKVRLICPTGFYCTLL